MSFLLDTNAVIALLRGEPGMLERVKARRPDEVSISSIVLHELHYGADRSARQQENVAIVDALRFPVIEFDTDDARVSGEIRARLADAGTTIGPYDVLIAGQALSRGLTLVTHNTREFSRVESLLLEDWEV
jgi:tRNA(fMet)-specific endonuclease VapC